MSGLEHFRVEGLDNGGVDLVHEPCEEIIASGGCICCDNNSVNLSALVIFAADHICKGPANG